MTNKLNEENNIFLSKKETKIKKLNNNAKIAKLQKQIKSMNLNKKIYNSNK